jgi:hypothetical protein
VIDGLPQDGPPSDLDADGILNANDNCPTKANPDQANEDGDSFGDVCDPCPWLGTVADNNDGDNDGVGDGCDPRPTTPGDRIVLFEGFAANAMPPLATVVGPGPWIFGGGTASISASGGMPAQLVWPLATYPLGETVYTHVTIDQLISFPAVIGITDQNNIAVNQGTACEVEAPNPTQNSVTLANVSGAIFMQNFFSQNVIGTPTIIRSTRQGAQQYTCTVTLTGLPSNASGAMGPTPIKAGFRVRNAAAHFDWIAVVSAQ